MEIKALAGPMNKEQAEVSCLSKFYCMKISFLSIFSIYHRHSVKDGKHHLESSLHLHHHRINPSVAVHRCLPTQVHFAVAKALQSNQDYRRIRIQHPALRQIRPHADFSLHKINA